MCGYLGWHGFKGRLGVFLFNLRDRFLKDIEGDHGFMFVDDERRAKADGSFAAAEDHEAALKGENLDAVAQGIDRLARGLVLYQLDADHEATTANITDHGMSLLPAGETVQHEVANASGIGQAFALDDVHGGKRRSNGDRVATKG